MIKTTLKSIVLLVILFSVFIAYKVLRNNQQLEPVQMSDLQQSYEDAVAWLLNHERDILEQDNAMLWSMIQRSAAISGDERLIGLFSRFKARHVSSNAVWRGLFESHVWVPVKFEQLQHFPDYNQYFIYALYCDSDFAGQAIIQQQNNVGFCGALHMLRPACVTHQLMGIRIRVANKCGETAWLDQVSQELLEKVETQLVWDFRVVDVYLQRVLMLLESGQADRIKPIWVRNIIDAQQDDGGWGNIYPIFRIGSKVIGLKNLTPHLGQQQSTYHATAQGIFLNTLLLHHEKHDPAKGWMP